MNLMFSWKSLLMGPFRRPYIIENLKNMPGHSYVGVGWRGGRLSLVIHIHVTFSISKIFGTLARFV